jgi:hypothetical protein
MTTDTFLFNAGWLFFAAWIAVIAGVSVAAFGRDVLPSKAFLDPAQSPHAAEDMRPANPRRR